MSDEKISCGKCIGRGKEIEGGTCRYCGGCGELFISDIYIKDGHDPQQFIWYEDTVAPKPLIVGVVGVAIVASFILTAVLGNPIPLWIASIGLVLSIGFLPPFVNSKRNAVGNCWHCGGQYRPSNGPTDYQCSCCHWDCPDSITL